MPSRITRGLPRRKFTVAEVERMVRKGLIAEKERFELIGGEIIPMSPKGNWHENVKRQLLEHFYDNRGERLWLIPETTFRLSRETFIEPDILVFEKTTVLKDIAGTNVLLAVEIADTSLAYDLNRKPLLYAHFGIRELWVIDAKQRVTTIHREPRDNAYTTVSSHGPAEKLTPLLAPELAISLGTFRT